MCDSADNAAAAEARWRNYQHLIWTQQQIHLQIQQQQQQQHQPQQIQSSKMNGIENAMENGMNNHGLQSLPLSEKSLEEKSKGEGMDPWDNFDAQAAFLGPSLWDKRLPYDGQDFKLEYVDLEEFLTENGIPVENHHLDNHFMKSGPSNDNTGNNGGTNGPIVSGNNGMAQDQASNVECSQGQAGAGMPPQHGGAGGMMGPHLGPGPSRNPQQGHNIANNSHPHQQNLLRGPPSINQSEISRSPSPCGSSISSDESLEGSLHHHHRGPDFDPRTRIFTEDELKPQPMIKKSKKQFVPDEQKDAKYWARRRKNNMAAKRSRDARRVKENQIAMRACFLEKENSILKQEIDRIQKENMILKEQLTCCRREH